MNLRKSMAFGLGLLGLVTLSVPAQSQVWFGFIAGPSFSNIKRSGDPAKVVSYNGAQYKYESITRFRFGVFADFKVSKKMEWLRFTPEISYTNLGAVQKVDSVYAQLFVQPGFNGKYYNVDNYDFSYVQIPLNFRASLQLTNPKPLYPDEGKGKPLFLDFIVGPYLGYALSAKTEGSMTSAIKYAQSTSEAEFDTVYKTKYNTSLANFNKLDFGVQFGIGLKWKFSRKSFLYVDFRMMQNFANLNGKDQWTYKYPDPADQTKTITVTPKINQSATFIHIGYITHFSKRRYFHLF